MNSDKITCQKYVFEQNEYNSSPILELSVKFASQICHENTNTPLDGAYLADFGIDITLHLFSALPEWTEMVKSMAVNDIQTVGMGKILRKVKTIT